MTSQATADNAAIQNHNERVATLQNLVGEYQDQQASDYSVLMESFNSTIAVMQEASQAADARVHNNRSNAQHIGENKEGLVQSLRNMLAGLVNSDAAVQEGPLN